MLASGTDPQLALPLLMLQLARRPKVCSLGGGVDSWAMLLDAELRGELPDIVAFVDVGDPLDRDTHPGEWEGTYRHIQEVVKPWCAARGIEFVEISARTGYMVRDARSLFQWFWERNQIPVKGDNRICTRIAKVERFEQWLDKRFPGQEVEVWVGFDAAETDRVDSDPNAGDPRGPTRMRPRSLKSKSKRALLAAELHNAFLWTRALAWAMTHARRVNRFPLVERGLCRCRCVELARASGYPVPRKSACMGCCYNTKGDWQRLAVEVPTVFDKFVALEDKKPLTSEGKRLTIGEYNSKTQTGTPLRAFVAKSYTPKVIPCPVCGAANRATKAAGCGYLDDNAPASEAA